MYDFLDRVQDPYILETNLTSEEFLRQMVEMYGENIKDSFFILDGNNMKNTKELFIEFQNIMEFPDYFGHNFDAFDECMRDLHDWLDVDEYILFIKNADNIFINEKNKQEKIDILIDSFNFIGKELSVPIQYEDPDNVNNRKAYPFHVILPVKN
ncbi:barstar family protein [Arcobacter sp.]|uniref:barstar family protein n=1 Tax=Arcobacter sp. TaxID=1872629 RepID=UPI003D12F35B